MSSSTISHLGAFGTARSLQSASQLDETGGRLFQNVFHMSGYTPIEPDLVPKANRDKEEAVHPASRNVSALQNPKRRLEGFVVQNEGEKTKVALLENNVLHYYRFPTTRLTKKAITEKNQPFEMSEFEVIIEEEIHHIYVFKPLARRADRRKRPIRLNDERRAKLDFILRGGKDADL